MKIGTLTAEVKFNIKLSLWDAIKCRIAGLPYFKKHTKIDLMDVKT